MESESVAPSWTAQVKVRSPFPVVNVPSAEMSPATNAATSVAGFTVVVRSAQPAATHRLGASVDATRRWSEAESIRMHRLVLVERVAPGLELAPLRTRQQEVFGERDRPRPVRSMRAN